MESLNKVTLIGNLAADVELRETTSGKKVANFPLAINRKIKNGKEEHETVDFHRVITWGKLAKKCEQCLSRGLPVLVEGELINRSFDDKEGCRHYRTEVVAKNVAILASRKSRENVEVLFGSIS